MMQRFFCHKAGLFWNRASDRREPNEQGKGDILVRYITVVIGDIAQFSTDAIVNSANPSLLAGSGVSGAIHRAAGPELELACRAIGSCAVGDAVVTPAFKLPAKWVIHAVGPRWLGGTRGEETLLFRCYESIYSAATALGACNLTIPSISTGIYHFPLKLAAPIAISSTRRFTGAPVSVTFVCFDQLTKDAYDQAISEL